MTGGCRVVQQGSGVNSLRNDLTENENRFRKQMACLEVAHVTTFQSLNRLH